MHKERRVVLANARESEENECCPHSDARSPTDDEHSRGTQRAMRTVSYMTFPGFQNTYYYY